MEPDALFADIERFIEESREALEQGALTEMGGLDSRVRTLCELSLRLSDDERVRYAEKLQMLFDQLQSFGAALIHQRDSVANELRHLSQHKKANTAYRTVEASDQAEES